MTISLVADIADCSIRGTVSQVSQRDLPLEDIRPMSVVSPSAVQRAGPIAEMAALLGEFGVASADVTRGTGIDLVSLTPDSPIPFSVVLDLLERAVVLTECSHFGLLLGARYHVASHGLITQLAAHEPTLRQALLTFVSLQPGYSTGATVYLNRLSPDFVLGYGIYDRTSSGSAQLYDCVLAFGWRFIRELTNGEVTPVEVLFCHREPDDLGPYHRVLSVPLRFNQNQSGLVIAGSAIDHLLPKTAQRDDGSLSSRSSAVLGLRDTSAAARLRHTIRPLLLSGDASMASAAKHLGQIPRTLRRHLASHGLTCPSSDDLRQLPGLLNGGSGSLRFDVMQLARGAASGGWRWSGA